MHKRKEVFYAHCTRNSQTDRGNNQKKNTSIDKMLKDCELGSRTVGHMKNGSMPSADKLATIAQYLGVSVEYLLGLTDDPTPPKKELTLEEQVAAEWYKMNDAEREQLKEYMAFLKMKKDLKKNLESGLTEASSELLPE